jgi:hypothetical protein
MKNVLCISLFAFSFMANAQFAGLLSGKDDAKKSSASAEQNQEAVVQQYKIVLGSLIKSEASFQTALGNSDKAETLSKKAKFVTGDSCDTACIKENTKVVTESSEQTAKDFKEASTKFDDEAKSHFSSGAVEYLKTTIIKMPVLVELAQNWNNTALDEVKSAGFMGAAKLKKKLDSGFFIVSNLPELGKLTASTTTSILGFAESQNIDPNDLKAKANGSDNEF